MDGRWDWYETLRRDVGKAGEESQSDRVGLNQNDGNSWATFRSFIGPLVFYVFERVWCIDREAYQDDVGL